MAETWREASPTQAIRATPAVWAAVRAVHARWQVEEPKLKLAETANRLLSYGLQHVLEVEREQEALEIHDDAPGE